MNKIRLQPHIILIALNVAIFLLQESDFDWRTEGALWQPENPNYHIWQWFTHMFLHESLMHLGFNMFALGSFMPPLLRVWTAKRVWALYFASGLAGAAAYLPFMGGNSSMLGASGAVFGVLAAFSAVYPKAPLSGWRHGVIRSVRPSFGRFPVWRQYRPHGARRRRVDGLGVCLAMAAAVATLKGSLKPLQNLQPMERRRLADILANQ